MKNFVLSLVAILVLTTTANAGAVKNVLIDAEDAITHEFFTNDREVVSIENHQLTTINGKIAVQADVETVNPFNNYPQSWVCVVFFSKYENKFRPSNVECN